MGLQPGSGDVTYSIDSTSPGATYFGVLPNGVIVTNRDLTTDTVNTQTYTVSSLLPGRLGLLCHAWCAQCQYSNIHREQSCIW